MTNPQTLPPPYDRIVAILELAAAAAGGHVAYETTVRARKTGDLVPLDAAVYLPKGSDEQLYGVAFVTGDESAAIEAVDAMAGFARGADASGAAVVCANGFSRPARKRADEEGVALIVPGETESEGLPSWLSRTTFESQAMQWRVRNISLPPVPGLPKNLLEQKFTPKDELFANPQGRHFTPNELLRRWMKVPQNERSLRDGLPSDGRKVTRDVTLHFDRPMRILANTVKPLPPIRRSDFKVEAWMDVRRIPLALLEAPPAGLPGEPRCAYASALLKAPDGQGGVRLWMWRQPSETAGEEPRLRMEMMREAAPAPAGAEDAPGDESLQTGD